jgi:hypothetical protein
MSHTHSVSDIESQFSRLNDQLGIILAHAELLEVKSAGDANRRAHQIVSSALEAMSASRELRVQVQQLLK